jgi:hypothetical protein
VAVSSYACVAREERLANRRSQRVNAGARRAAGVGDTRENVEVVRHTVEAFEGEGPDGRMRYYAPEIVERVVLKC